jgi:ABC-type branched-subunit amino acid transport system ATPase component
MPDPIRIGHLTVKTGPLATGGIQMEQGLSLMLVEQNPKLVFGIADDVVILNSGRVAMSGSADEIERSKLNLREHLGVY